MFGSKCTRERKCRDDDEYFVLDFSHLRGRLCGYKAAAIERASLFVGGGLTIRIVHGYKKNWVSPLWDDVVWLHLTNKSGQSVLDKLTSFA